MGKYHIMIQEISLELKGNRSRGYAWLSKLVVTVYGWEGGAEVTAMLKYSGDPSENNLKA